MRSSNYFGSGKAIVLIHILKRRYTKQQFCLFLNGCETWSMTLREENRQKNLANRVLRRSGPKRDEVTEDWRRLRNKELYDFYYYSNIFR